MIELFYTIFDSNTFVCNNVFYKREKQSKKGIYMLLAKDFREEARNALSGKWGVAVGTGFVAGLLGAYTALGSSGGSSSSSSDTASEELYSSLPEEVIVVIAVVLGLIAMVALIWALVQFIIGGAITLGYVKFNLDLVDGKKVKFSDLFSQFDRFGEGFLLQLLRTIFITLWTLLFIIPGVIATYRYAMAPYILHENPGMSASEAIRQSKEMMDGNKGRLFCLNFSFIGWDLLCVLTLGIGYLWLQPYREAAYAAFYREISASKYASQDITMDSIQTDFNPYDANRTTYDF